ncbi:MAG: hypothetical protein J0H19_18705 [Rhodospirillales bacterium]|nr:hypothetical protein [Rhodospirillales bacterium]MBN8928646.1 hypothetical protein [Rhodospirillales bacterium]
MTTKTYAFGAGSVIALVDGKTPVKVGTLQDIEIDVSSDTAMLYGQNQYPVAIGRGKGKVEGKAKTGQIDLNLINSVYQQGTIDTTGYEKLVELEAGAVPSSTSYDIQVTNHTGFVSDMGVYYASTGVQLTQVDAGSEASGKYSIDTDTGTYTFASADADASVLISYTYKATTGQQITLTNALMGDQPVFELFLQEGFNDFGARTNTTMRLHRCISSKLTFPFKNTDFALSEFDFSCFADNLDRIFTMGIGT